MNMNEYQLYYGRALPLRPLPGILEYIKYYEKESNNILKKIYSDKVSLTISQSMKTLNGYWLPEKNFGTIEIKGESTSLFKIALSILKTDPATSISYSNGSLQIKTNPVILSASLTQHNGVSLDNTDYKLLFSFIGDPSFNSSMLSFLNSEDMKKLLLDQYNKLTIKQPTLDKHLSNYLFQLIKNDLIKKDDLQDGGALLLCYACQNNDFKNIQYLLETKGFDVFSRTIDGVNVLYYALCLREKNLLGFDLIEYLFSRMKKSVFTAKQQNELEETLAKEALTDPGQRSIALMMLSTYHLRTDQEMKHFEEQFNFLLELYKPVIFMKDEHGRSLLHALASSYDDPAIISRLVKAGLDIKQQDEDDKTILHYAIWSMNFEMIRYLVTHHKELLTIEDKFGNTPTVYAIKDNCISMDMKAMTFLLNQDDNFTLDQLNQLAILINSNANINKTDKEALINILNKKIDNPNLPKKLYAHSLFANASDKKDCIRDLPRYRRRNERPQIPEIGPRSFPSYPHKR